VPDLDDPIPCAVSVFEIEVEPAPWTALRAQPKSLIKPGHDSLRYYFLGANWQRRIEHAGASPRPILAAR
jgi:CRISPR-associated protein Cas2